MADAFDLGDSGFDGVSGGAAAPKSSVVPQHDTFDPFAAAQAAAVPTVAAAAPLSNPTATSAAPAAGAAVASTKPAASPTAADNKADSKDDPAQPTPYSLWEAKKKQQLAEKQQKADELKRAAGAAAKQDIAKFLAARDERIAQRKIENRTEEKSSAAATKQVMGYGSHAMFEKIGKLVDTSAKGNEKRPGVDRFRKLLIQLKSNPPQHIAGGSAAGASGGADAKLASP